MYQFPIGVILDSFRVDIPTALKKAVEVGAQGIQVYSTYGEMSPENLVGQKRKDFLKMVKDNGLVISALCGDLGHGFGNAEKNPELIERSKRILDLAKELETNIVTLTSASFLTIPSTSDIRSCRRPASSWRSTPILWTLISPSRPALRLPLP